MGEQVKLLLTFDVRPGRENAFRRFVAEELLPQAQELGLVPTDAWHTAYGKYPNRLIGFVAEDLKTAQEARATLQWQNLMKKLESYTENLSQRLVRLRGGFQW
jgi:hypothetical protein